MALPPACPDCNTVLTENEASGGRCPSCGASLKPRASAAELADRQLRLAKQSWQAPLVCFLLSAFFGVTSSEYPTISVLVFALGTAFGLGASIFVLIKSNRRRSVTIHAFAGLIVSLILTCMAVGAYLMRP